MRAWLRAHETAAVGLLMVVPALAAVGGLIVYPLVRGFQQSIESSGQFGQQQRYVGLRNYRQVLDDPTATDAMRHTVEYVLLAVSLELVLGVIVAVTLRGSSPGAAWCSRCSCPVGASVRRQRRALAARLRPRQRLAQQLPDPHPRDPRAARLARRRRSAIAFITVVHV